MSERRRSAAALSSRAHAFSVEALIGSNKKRKLRGWEEKELQLSMESLAAEGDEPAHCLDMEPGQCAHTLSHTHTLTPGPGHNMAPRSVSVSESVCVYVREREREKEGEQPTTAFSFSLLCTHTCSSALHSLRFTSL